MHQNKVRVDRILASILIIVLSTSLIMFSIRLLIGSNYKKVSNTTFIVKETSTLEAEKVVITALVSEEINLDNISEEIKNKYNEKKNAIIQATKQNKKIEEIKPLRKELELLIYDIKQTNEIIKNQKTRMRVDQGVHYVDQIVIVNKKYALPESYDPKENPEAKNSFLKLINDMQKENFSISNSYIGYRDFNAQKLIYSEIFRKKGQKAADDEVMRAGHSEYQTGLTFSILNRAKTVLGSSKEDATSVEWLKNNAHRYGFVIRYPQEKEAITGVGYQPYTLRYLGLELAKQVFESQKTLEEYFEFTGGNYSE